MFQHHCLSRRFFHRGKNSKDVALPSDADLLLAQLGKPSLVVDDNHAEVTLEQDDLEIEWTAAIDQRYGQIDAGPSAASSSKGKRQPKSKGASATADEVPSAAAAVPAVPAVETAADDTAPTRVWIDQSNHRVFAEFASGKTRVLGA